MAAGGKGANQAVAAARLGAQVTLVAKVGRDMLGDQSADNFAREGIVCDYLLRDADQATGVALILVDDQGENLISVAPGANFALSADEVRSAEPALRGADILLLQLEVPIGAVRTAAELAAAAGVRVVLNPAPAAPLDDALLGCLYCLTPNESEAERLTGIAVRDEAGARAAAEQLLKRGVGHVVVTLGSKGSLLADAEGVRMVPTRSVQAVDTTAAGDAFNGGLACALARGESLDSAARYASLVGAFSVTRLGAQPSMPTAAELRQFAG